MKRSGLVVMARLIGLVKPLIGYMILAITLGLIGNLCASFITIFGGFAILNVLDLDAPFSLTTIFISVVVFAILRAGLRYGEQTCNHFIAFKLLAIIRDKVFKALRKLAPAKLEGKDKGDLITIITSDIELLEVFYAHTISPIAIWILYTIVMIVFISSYHPTLGIVALVGYITVGIIIPLIISKLSGDNGDRYRNKAGSLSSYILDSLRGLTETLQYGRGNDRLNSINNQSAELSKEEEKLKAMSGRNTAISNTVILVFDLIMLFTATSLFNNGEIGFDGVLIATIALFSSFGPSVALAALGSTLQNTFAAGNRVLDVLDETPIIEDVTNGKDIIFDGANVNNVSFSYDKELILDKVSFDFPKNKVIGIVGKSGSGKSTLLKLLMRFWQVNDGEIKVSNTNVNEINTTSLRDNESYVTQETQLFHDSIRNNIRIAKLDASDEEIIEACKKASAHDFIMSLPDGYDTAVGELGETLSGGERQRLGLARAFLHDAPFMLLDEPTSNLDSLNEAIILKALDEERENKTIVLVSHRQSTMRIADKVYSVENGRMS